MSAKVYPRETAIDIGESAPQTLVYRGNSRNQLPNSPTDDSINTSKPVIRHTDTRTGLQRTPSAKMITQMLPSRMVSVPGTYLTRKDLESQRRRSLAAQTLSRFRLQSIDQRDGDDTGDEQYTKKRGLVRQYATSLKRKRDEFQKLKEEEVASHPRGLHKKYGAAKKVKWKIFKQRIKETFNSFTLWKSHLKEIEGQYGNGVLSYFIFLKWLFYLDLTLGFMWFGFVCMPEILLINRQVVSANNATLNISNALSAGRTGSAIYCSRDYITNTTYNTNQFIVVISGKGDMECSELFYGNYSADVITTSGSSAYYNMPFAYFVVALIHFVLSLILVARSASATYRRSYIEGGDTIHQYCNKLFGAWDYCICDDKASVLKMKSIAHDIKVDLAEEIRAAKAKERTSREKFFIYFKRLIINVIVLGLLTASGVAIYYAANVTINSQGTSGSGFLGLLQNYAASLTISALNIALPWVFTLLIQYESYSPNFEIQLTLVRTVFLKLASVIVLLATLFQVTRTAAATGESASLLCWETYVGQELFKLVVMNFIVVVFATILVEFPQRFIADKFEFQDCCCEISRPEFQIPKNVLDLVYAQVLCWLGAFYCPLIPFMIVVSFFIIFYVKKVSLIYNNRPSQRPYRASRSNSFFMLLLIISFFLAAFPVGYGITSMTPSKQCGPFRSQTTVITAVSNIIRNNLPVGLWDAINFIFSAGFVIPLILIMGLALYYFRSLARARSAKIQLLKEQLVMEGRDKAFLLDQLSQSDEPLEGITEENEDEAFEDDRV